MDFREIRCFPHLRRNILLDSSETWCRAEGCPSKPHKKKEHQCEDFKAEFATIVAREQAAEQQAADAEERPARRLKLWWQDESRFGLRTIRRRRITLKGVKPVMAIQEQFENLYLYGAFCPEDGASVVLEMPTMDTVCMQEFLNIFSLESSAAETLNIVTMDNAGIHRSKRLIVPENVRIVSQPAYAPELNPSERVWEHCKAPLSGVIFADLDALSDRLVKSVNELTQDVIQSLTSFEWIVRVINGQLVI